MSFAQISMCCIHLYYIVFISLTNYNENINKCIMGECDVPSTKYKNGSFKKTFHFLSCHHRVRVNMMNHAHVLSKYQVAETIQRSERIDFHSDGTSRDHKKIIGVIPCQINQFFAKFARPDSDFDEIWHTWRLCLKKIL